MQRGNSLSAIPKQAAMVACRVKRRLTGGPDDPPDLCRNGTRPRLMPTANPHRRRRSGHSAGCCRRRSNASAMRPSSVEGGQAALDLLNSADGEGIALIILDLVMPDIDGMAVLAKLRERERPIPVIVQTAHGGIDSVVNAMRAGAVDFVVKPASRRAPAGLDRERAEARRARRRTGAHEARRLRHAHLPRHRHPQPGDGARDPPRPARRRLADPDPDRRRVRRRQGTDRPRHPGRQRPPLASRSSPSIAAPSPTTSSRASSSATRRAPSPAPPTSTSASSAKPTAARSSSTRSANCRSTSR